MNFLRRWNTCHSRSLFFVDGNFFCTNVKFQNSLKTFQFQLPKQIKNQINVIIEDDLIEIESNFKEIISNKYQQKINETIQTSYLVSSISLLIAKLIENHNKELKNKETIWKKQILLTKTAEMVFMAHLIHQDKYNNKKSEETKKKVQINLLFGDYLLAQSSYQLSLIGNLEVQDLISKTIISLVESELLFNNDITKLHEYKASLQLISTILQNTTKASGLLFNLNQNKINEISEFARLFAENLQIYDDMLLLNSNIFNSNSTRYSPLYYLLKKDISELEDLIHVKNEYNDKIILEKLSKNSDLGQLNQTVKENSTKANMILSQFESSPYLRILIELSNLLAKN